MPQSKVASVNRPAATRMPKGLAAKAGTQQKKAAKDSKPALQASSLPPTLQKEPPVEARMEGGEFEEDSTAPPPILRELEEGHARLCELAALLRNGRAPPEELKGREEGWAVEPISRAAKQVEDPREQRRNEELRQWQSGRFETMRVSEARVCVVRRQRDIRIREEWDRLVSHVREARSGHSLDPPSPEPYPRSYPPPNACIKCVYTAKEEERAKEELKGGRMEQGLNNVSLGERKGGKGRRGGEEERDEQSQGEGTKVGNRKRA